VWETVAGEILTSCEKIRYLVTRAEGDVKKEKREVPLLLKTKVWLLYFVLSSCRSFFVLIWTSPPLFSFFASLVQQEAWVEYAPCGVIGLIVPWVCLFFFFAILLLPLTLLSCHFFFFFALFCLVSFHLELSFLQRHFSRNDSHHHG
jgi:hypothetical protein